MKFCLRVMVGSVFALTSTLTQNSTSLPFDTTSHNGRSEGYPQEGAEFPLTQSAVPSNWTEKHFPGARYTLKKRQSFAWVENALIN